MLQFLTSLTFLYVFVISLMIGYGWVYYRSFIRNGYQHRLFPWLFLLIAAGCFSFLYFNIHAPLKQKTFSNLDHHFIRHDGFRVTKQIELGRTDTVNYRGNPYNSFLLAKNNNQVSVTSVFSEEPFYIYNKGKNRLVSVNYPVAGHNISFRVDSAIVKISGNADNSLELLINSHTISQTRKKIRKGLTAWSVFQDDTSYINSGWYNNEQLSNSLRNIMLLRNDFSSGESGELKYFLSGRLFRYANAVKFDNTGISINNLYFSAKVNDKSLLGWGLGFPDKNKNKNQFRVENMGADGFDLACRYPVSYPLTEEPLREDAMQWESHDVTKFLISDPSFLKELPAVFNEGFLFTSFPGDSSIDFNPALLSYRKSSSNESLQLQVSSLRAGRLISGSTGDQLLLPARSADFSWKFSLVNSFNWDFGNHSLPAKTWHWLLFGSLLFFFLMVFFSSWLKPANQLSWVWQILSCVTIVMLSTRFFLYWRYKTFPPYEGLDLPSLQQLNSFWNFGIIIMASLLLGLVFGSGLIKYLYHQTRKKISLLLNKPFKKPYSYSPASNMMVEKIISRIPVLKNTGAKMIFFSSWVFILLGGGALAAAGNFDLSTCRHLAIVLVLLYFAYTYASCKYSPLVAVSEKSWWSINTGKLSNIIISNPVKLLLSISLLALFSLIDIGFALIFFNFLLFNEAFLFINYSIAGLSAGSRKNASLFGIAGVAYLLLFAANLIYGPYIFQYLLDMPSSFYMAGYLFFAFLVAYSLSRLVHSSGKRRVLVRLTSTAGLFLLAFLFFPKERIQKKAAATKYRIDVLTMPADKAVIRAYEDGHTYEPVIRAAQNQWFINSFIYEENNPAVNSAGFNLLPHAPQNRGAKYNAQATDLVTSRFMLAEHGRWSVLLYALLLFLPMALLAFFYKLYPDFTNRINISYPSVITGFSILNYLLITALLVILAATGRYIFFGQDLPFGSILSKQSILFPAALIIIVVLLFRNISLQQYPNRGKLLPGAIVFAGLFVLLFFVKPVYNKGKEFGVADLSKNMDAYIQSTLQPMLDEIDSSAATRRLPVAKKDQLFCVRVNEMLNAGLLHDAGMYLQKQVEQYCRSGFSNHLDQNRMLFLDLNSGNPQLAVNENFFHIEAPPHLRQPWTGNVYGDTTSYNISLWNAVDGSLVSKRVTAYTNERRMALFNGLEFTFRKKISDNLYDEPCLVNTSATALEIKMAAGVIILNQDDTLSLRNPDKIYFTGPGTKKENILLLRPDAFMRNYYVNGSRFYMYPTGSDFIWARNFAESISADYTSAGQSDKNVFLSLNAQLTDSLSAKMKRMVMNDTAYKKGAEYGICIADGNGRLLAMPDFIKELDRPDPNDKAAFNKAIRGENGFITQSALRKKIGNINLLRMNPGPGSTLKPIVFSAIASQLPMDWDAFAAEGFSQKQQFFGGEKVPEYDFEKNNGRIASVSDYLKYSDNYYHSNLLLLGSYSRQSLSTVLSKYFTRQDPATGSAGYLTAGRQDRDHWPYFIYKGQQYWLNGFENWPGYAAGKANFGSDSSFVSVGLFSNYGIHTYNNGRSFDKFALAFDSTLFAEAWRKSGFILPEYALFDQKGTGMNMHRPNEVFISSFRGHVKGSSQVMIPPVKMLDVYGKLTSQNRNWSLTLDPYATDKLFSAFYTDNGVAYSSYLSLMKESVFTGMREALFKGTAAKLGVMLKNGSPYFYYAKTGTTGDDELKTKSKLFAVIISKRDVASPDFNFRKNKFIIIYFTSQNGPAKQHEEFQTEVIRYVQDSPVFKKYMETDN